MTYKDIRRKAWAAMETGNFDLVRSILTELKAGAAQAYEALRAEFAELYNT